MRRGVPDVTNADIRAVIAKAPPDGILDQQIRASTWGSTTSPSACCIGRRSRRSRAPSITRW
jgi:hypothetical protein